jgi:hypothetical protein
MSIVMQNDGIEETIIEWWNNIPNELKIQKEIESYDKVMEIHPKYPVIIYNHVLRYKQRLKKIVS